MKTTYLVTGATGHVGVNLVKQLFNNGKTVRALILPNDENVKYIQDYASVFFGDVRDKETLEPFFDCPSDSEIIVIHCAAKVTINEKFDQNVWDTNVVGTQNILDMCNLFHVKRMIHVSSVHAIPELENNQVMREVSEFKTSMVRGIYAKTKAAASQLVLDAAKKGLNVSIVHPSGILGPNDYIGGHMTQLINEFLNGTLPAKVPGGYDFVDVRDVVSGILSCIDNGRQGECYILSNKSITIHDILAIASRYSGLREIKLTIPVWMAKLSAPAMGAYYRAIHKRPLYTSYSMYTLSSNSNFSHQKATEELNYHPRDIEETIKDTIDFLRENQLDY